MDCKLVKEVVKFTIKSGEHKGEESQLTNFYLILPNGNKVRIMPNVYEDDKKVKHSNFSTLNAIASDINSLPF